MHLEAATFGHEKSSGTFLQDQTLAEKMPLLHIALKSSTGRIHFNLNLKWRKKFTCFWALWNPLQIVSQTTIHLLGQQGTAGVAMGFIQRVGTDFKAPSGSQTPGLCYSHLFTWTELLGYLQNCGRRVWRELPSPVIPLESLCLHCLGCPCPSALPPGCYFDVKHVFLCVDPLFP